MKTFQLTIFCATIALSISAKELDLDLKEDGAYGQRIVHAVIAEIAKVNIFNNSDHGFLRRLAYVETRDGTTYPSLEEMADGGGIWSIDNSTKISILKDASARNESIANKMAAANASIEKKLGIDILNQKDAQFTIKPLYCGAAARFYLYYLQLVKRVSIPSTIAGQAEFWVEYFCVPNRSRSCSVVYFLESVKHLGCKVNADIFFVLDMSNSVSLPDFEEVRNFITTFVEDTIIGPDATQVGVIVYGNEARVEINLNSYNNKTELLEAIESIPYDSTRQSTNTADGLCKLVRHGYAPGKGSRDSATVYRVAIVMTDGRSNYKSHECDWNTLTAAAAVHNITPEVVVYSIGVSDNVNTEELQAIASDERYCYYIDNFHAALEGVQDAIEYNICWEVYMKYDSGNSIHGTLMQDRAVRYELEIPKKGVNVTVCVENGQVIVRGSTYDFRLVFICNSSQINKTCQTAFVQPSADGKRRSIPDATLYISIVGLAKENVFIMNTTEGYVTPSTPSTETSIPTNSEGHTHEKIFILATAGSSAFLLFVLTYILIMTCFLYGFTVYRKKKKQQTKKDDEYALLDNEYVEM